MKLSIAIPCYNELKTIETVVEAVKNCPYQNKEIIKWLLDRKLRNQVCVYA
jgi:cellulose synthase/poly-beta-1,6-N-acetylglucosamine synthase-like glycosyltransferase